MKRWILARLRIRRFFSLAELNQAIREQLEKLNDRAMEHLGNSRRQNIMLRHFWGLDQSLMSYLKDTGTEGAKKPCCLKDIETSLKPSQSY